jgi:FkbM family methyltransferase
VVNLLRRLLHFIPPDTVVPILQSGARGCKWIVGSGRHAYWLGTYESVKRVLFERVVRPGDVVFDVGAHVGFYTLLAAKLVGLQGKVFAFEPLPENLVYLKQHLVLNRISNVEVIEAAISDRPGIATFNYGPSRSEGHISPQGELMVRVMCLDDLIAGERMPLPDCLKIDVEGEEAHVLNGARLVLEARSKMLLATHGIQVQEQCLAILHKAGYTVELIETDPMHERNEIFAY